MVGIRYGVMLGFGFRSEGQGRYGIYESSEHGYHNVRIGVVVAHWDGGREWEARLDQAPDIVGRGKTREAAVRSALTQYHHGVYGPIDETRPRRDQMTGDAGREPARAGEEG